MKKPVALVLTLGGLATSALTGCSTAADDGLTIGVVFVDESSPNTAPIRESMQEVASAQGATLVTTDSKSDTAKELTDVENLITQGVDAIIMQPIDSQGSQHAASLIVDSGIPLFTVNTTFTEEADIEITSYIGQNESEAGAAQAEYMNEQLSNGGEIVFIAGTYGASWTDMRRTGFDEAISANFNIAAEFQADCSRDKAQRAMEDILQRHPAGELVGVVAQCDETAIGASLAIAEADRQDDFTAFVSVDGDPAGLEAIQAGIVTATVAQDFKGQGATAAEVAIAFLNGEEVESEYATPATLVTAENVGEFVGD